MSPAVSDEFTTVGYRMHSTAGGRPGRQCPAAREEDLVHGEFEPIVDGRKLVIPLALAFGNPDLLQSVGLGPLRASLAAEPQYRNDEQIDNSLRSVPFEAPKPGVPDRSACGAP